MHPLHAHNRYAYPLPPSHHHPQQSIAAQHQHQHHASNHMTTQAPAINSLDNANVGRGVVSSVSVEPSIMMSRQNNTNNGSLATTTVDPYQAVRKKTAGGCTCKKSKCLKLYCQCFASSFLCGPECSCASCHNTSEFVSERKDAIRVILERNPNAFQTKFQQTGDGTSSARNRNSSSVRTAAAKGVAGSSTNTTSVVVEHKVGCKCRKSSCLKKYCECYSANVKCSSACRCINCYNVAPPAMGFRRNGVPVVVNSCGMIQESSLVETLKQNNNNNKHVVVSDPSRLMMPMMHQTFGQSNSSSSRDDVYERVVYAPISTAVEESRSDAPTGVQRNKFIREVSNTKELSSTETEEDAAAALMALMMGGGNSLSRKRQSHRHSTTTAMCSSQLGGDSIGSTNSSNSNGPTMVSVTASTASASFDTNSSVSFDHAPDNEDSNDGHHQSSNGYNSASAPPSKRMRRISEESMQKWPSPPPPSFSKHESRNPSPEHESIHRGGQAMISLSQIQHRMPFGMTPCDVSRYTPTMKRKSLPKGLSYRKICSRCGKTRSEHGELGFGNKVNNFMHALIIVN